jgi:DNA-binding protein HU-beta
LEAITDALARGEEVKLFGFGSFVVTKRAAGEARNPRTGETVQVEESLTPKFKAGASLRQAVNAKGEA